MFQHLVDVLRQEGLGVLAYQTCARAAVKAAHENLDLAAPYFLLAYGARRFVEAYENEPLTSEQAYKELQQYENYVAGLNHAYAFGDRSEKLEALNSIATNLLDSERTS